MAVKEKSVRMPRVLVKRAKTSDLLEIWRNFKYFKYLPYIPIADSSGKPAAPREAPMQTFVAVRDRIIVGFVQFKFSREERTWALKLVSVKKGFRRFGIAKKLTGATSAYLNRLGVSRLHIYADENEAAEGLYKKTFLNAEKKAAA
ncbi:MAG: GNAT family N-acetyltransferase [Candidatus Diapherotrites archaeon]|nr:GNAT family N-acetyltransferase [Candidatus Diapherotrites archaeon]